MREYPVQLSKGLSFGLRREATTPANSAALVLSEGMMPRDEGLIATGKIVNPFSASPIITWPFPQLIRGRGYTLLGNADFLGLVTEGSPWTSAAITTYDYHTQASTLDVVDGGVWHVADFNDKVIILFNGACTVIRTFASGMTGGAEKWLVEDELLVGTGCSFRGRGFFAGFAADGEWSDEWAAFFTEKLTGSAMAAISGGDIKLTERYVLWTPIGKNLLSFLQPPEDPERMIRENQFGFMPMAWRGGVNILREMQEGVLCLGDGGVSVLTPIQEPMPTFSRHELSRVSVSGRGRAGGDVDGCVFVDDEGALWIVSGDLKIERLGYSEFLSPLLENDLQIHVDPRRREYYISGEDDDGVRYGFVLTRSGLGQTNQRPTSVALSVGNLYGLWDYVRYTDEDSTPGVPGGDYEAENTDSLIVTERFNCGNNELKTLTTVEVVYDWESGYGAYDQTFEVAVDWRNSGKAAWIRSPFVRANPAGFARPQVTAVEFRVVIRFQFYYGLRVTEVNARYQQVGHVNVRGIGANSSIVGSDQ